MVALLIVVMVSSVDSGMPTVGGRISQEVGQRHIFTSLFISLPRSLMNHINIHVQVTSSQRSSGADEQLKGGYQEPAAVADSERDQGAERAAEVGAV